MSASNTDYSKLASDSSDRFLKNLITISDKRNKFSYTIKNNGFAYTTDGKTIKYTGSYIKWFIVNSYIHLLNLVHSDQRSKFYICDVKKGKDLACFLALTQFDELNRHYETCPSEKPAALETFKNRIIQYANVTTPTLAEISALMPIRSVAQEPLSVKLTAKEIEAIEKKLAEYREIFKKLFVKSLNEITILERNHLQGEQQLRADLESLINPVLMALDEDRGEGKTITATEFKEKFLEMAEKKFEGSELLDDIKGCSIDVINSYVFQHELNRYFELTEKLD